MKKTKRVKDPLEQKSAEEKIKEAARKVFTQKGYAAARTRDIAEEAGMNLALLNYYFRSKEKLFEIVMMENVQQFVLAMLPVFFDQENSLKEKVTVISGNYIDMLKTNPDLPVFILSEIRANPERFAKEAGFKDLIMESQFVRQLSEAAGSRFNPMHLFVNILGLSVFPFIANPILKTVAGISQEEFDTMMDERKKLIPIWIDQMISNK